jgi:hypothetical protein
MVDPGYRDTVGDVHPHGEADTDQERAGKARTVGYGNEADVPEADAGALKRRLSQPVNPLQVRAGSHLRHHPAVSRVLRLGMRERRQHAPPAKEGDRGLVAGGFYAHDYHTHKYILPEKAKIAPQYFCVFVKKNKKKLDFDKKLLYI